MKETGVGIYNPLFFIGVVENNVDKRFERRVQVRAFGVHGTKDQVPTESLPWATLIHGSYDPNAPLPPMNSFVFGFFVDGRDAQQPMILGLIPTQMTELLDPAITGWGNIPEKNIGILAKGSGPEDFGQPANSKLDRGEYIDETYVLTQKMNKISNIPVASDGLTEENETSFSEPDPAYNAQYPYNRVIETAAHSIELDDTPGAERITIHHKSGSYVSVDTRGTTVHKSIHDKYEINDVHQHVYVGGKSYVTIVGDSKVLVQGNKVEEIVGNYTQIVHGNHLISVAGQMNLNASEEVQMRAAKLRLQANVEGISIKAGKNIKIEGGEFIHMKSGATAILEAADAINLNAIGDNVNIQAAGEINVKSATMYLTAEGALDAKGGHVKLGGGTKVSIDASLVAIDDIIQLAEGQSIAPTAAGDAATADPAESPELPEPPAKSASTTKHKNTSSTGSGGYVSRDTSQSDSVQEPTTRQPLTSKKLTNAEVDKILSGPEPALARSEAEKFLGRKLTDEEWNNLVAATVAESLPNSPQEQAAIMAVILNRVRSDSYPNTVTEVLLQQNQFQAVTGTRYQPGPSSNFSNPNERQIASTIKGTNEYLGTMSKDWLNFTANNPAAYGPGTDITFRDRVSSSSNSRVIGGTVFGTVK